MLFHLITRLKQPYHFMQGLLANLLYGFPSRNLCIVGVTGTDGKTTTSTMIYNILKAAHKKVALISTVAAYLGDKEIDTGFHVTTPDPFALQRLFRNMVKQGVEYVVLEATSHGIYQYRLFGITPKVSVLTNVTHEHLDYHPSYLAYLEVKASFLARAAYAVLNKTDHSFDAVKKYIKKKNQETRILAYDVRLLPPTMRRFILDRFVEPYNRENATAAVTATEALNISQDDIMKGLQQFRGVVGRMEEVENSTGIRVIIDFAHTPNGLKTALQALRGQVKSGQKVIAVFGCAGLRDHSKRPIMGRLGSELADAVVFTTEDPRIEDVNTIIRQMKEGVVVHHNRVFTIVDRAEAIQFAVYQLAKPGDIVAIFGKGHEKSMNLDGKHEIPWSDREEVEKALTLRSRRNTS